MPILCNYYLTYHCNARCGFCGFSDHEKYKGSPQADTGQVLRNLPSLKHLGVRFIDFTGGEPLLHPEIGRFTHAAHRLGMKPSITTNCLLYPKRAEELRGSVYLLHFSLDSPVPEEHNASRGVDCFDHVMESIEIARRLGEHPDILFTVTDANVHHLPEIYDLSRNRGLILVLNPIFEYFREESLHRETLDAMERFGRKKMVYLNPSFLSLRRRGGNDTKKPLCRAVSRVIVISPDNHILLPCWHFYNESVSMDKGLEEAWRSPRITWHAERQGRHAFCEGCAINCYFEPSFAFPINGPSLASVPSKIRYGFHKLIRQRIFGS